MKYKGAGSQHKVQLGISYSKDLNLSAHLQSDQSLSFPPEEMLDPWLPIESDCANVQADLS